MAIFLPASTSGFTMTTNGVPYIQTAGTENLSPAGGSAISTGVLSLPELFLGGQTIGDANGLLINAASSNARIQVLSSGNVIGASNDGVTVRGSDTRLVNQGSISGFGDDGIEVASTANDSNISNSGLIVGNTDGISVSADNVRLANTGEISGQDGVHVFASGSMINTGQIISTGDGALIGNGVNLALEAAETYTIINSGTISGEQAAINGSGGVEIIFNSGTLNGDVNLGANDDVYRASGNGEVQGVINGGAGNDKLTGASASDEILGGDGNDRMRGNEGADTLEGGIGRDIMLGGDGEDVLTGGGDGDLMLGGAGADEFLFDDIGDVGTTSATRDEIRDFEQGIDIINLAPMIGPEFLFAGTGGFTGGGAASIRLVELAGSTFVQIDHDGDGSQDGRMLVRGVQDMTEADFIL